MEEDNDLEQVTGSPTAGENGYVHIESVDSAQMDGASIDQIDRLEQDDGVVVTGVDTVQYEPLDVRTTEEGGHDEFVDCPDDLGSNDVRSPGVGNRVGQQSFGNNTEDIQHRASDSGREILMQDYEQEERRALMKEVSNLHHQLKALNKQQSLIDGNDVGLSSDQLTSGTGEDDEKSMLPLREMITECSKFIELSFNERSQAEGTINDLHATLHMKDKEIEDLMVRVNEHSLSQDEILKSSEVSSVEATADRILSSLAATLGDKEFSDTSISGKLSHLEKNTSLLLEKYHHFLSEVEILGHCLAEVKSDFHMQNGMETVFLSVREELLELKRKELELAEKNSHLEDQQGQLMEQLDKGRETVEILNAEIRKLKGEVEQEKTRYSNTKEKLSMAVTKGKGLVQQRDSLKQLVAEKTSELERCLTELQAKSRALEAAELRNEELMRTEIMANSLQEALSQRDMVLEKCGEILSLTGELQSSDIIERVTWLANEISRLAPLSLEFQRLAYVLSSLGLPEASQSSNLVSQVSWLLESYNLAKDQSVNLQDQNDATREAARVKIDRLTASMLAEAQERYYLKEEFEDLTCKYEAIVEEKEKMVALLLDASGIPVGGMEDNIKPHSDMAMVIDRCFSKVKEQAIASPASSPTEKEVFEKLQNLLYVSDQESKLYEQILEEEKMYRLELDNRSNEIIKVSEELRASKDENRSLHIDLKRSEDKALLLREKLSMAVKKGKGLVQERENMKQQMAEKNAQIEAIKVDLQKQESTLSDCRDQINVLSTEVKSIAKLESDLLRLKEERDQIEQFLVESNTILQQVIETIDCIGLPVDLKEPVERVKWFATYLSECQVAKAQAEQELGDVKDESSMLASKLSEALMNMKSLEDALSVSEKNVFQLAEEKRIIGISKNCIEEELQKVREEWQVSKAHAEQEVQNLKEEVSMLNNKLVEALATLKSLEEELSGSEKTITRLTEEKRELEIAKSHVEEELHKAMEEATSQTSKVQEASANKNSLEEALSLAENNISGLIHEKEEAQANKVAAEMELKKVKEEVSSHAIKLDEAYKTIKSLEDAMSQLKTNVSQFSQENEQALGSRTILESEIKRLKEETEYHERKVVDSSATIETLEDALYKAENTVSDLVGENKIAEQEISTLNTKLSTCRQELAGKHDKWALELSGFFRNLQALLKDGSLLSLFKQSFEKKSESLKEIDRLLKDMKDNFDSEQLQDHPAIEESFQSSTFLLAGFDNDWNTGMTDDEFNAEDTEGIGSYVGRTLDNLNTRNQILADQFGRFSTLVDDMIASLLEKLEAIRNTVPFTFQQTKALKQNAKSMQMDEEIQDNRLVMLERGIKVLVSTCADVTKELKFHFENNMLQTDSALGLEKSNRSSSLDVRVVDEEAAADVKAAADELFFAARNVGSLIERYVSVKESMSTTVEELQGELEKTRSMYDKAKEENNAFQRRVLKLETELEASGNMCTVMGSKLEDYQAKENKWNEREAELSARSAMFQERVFKLEAELEASGNLCDEMSCKLEDYREKEHKWNEREGEYIAQSATFFKNHEAENALLSASQIKALFDKIDGITIPFSSLVVGDIQPQDSDPVKKLFYIVDSVNELLDQMTLLSHTKEELHSTLSKQALEVEKLKGEFEEAMKDKQDCEKMEKELVDFSIGLQNIIQKLGGDESVGIKKSADVAGLLPVLERHVQGIVLDSENSRSKAQELGAKLLETQKVVEELASKVNVLEDFIQNRTGAPDTKQERGVFEPPPLPARSEISEIEDQVSVGKVGIPKVPSAAHVRSLRKGSNDQLAITIDSASDRLIDKEDTVEDKGHIFKSLNTSGLVPVRGKMIADRVDGIWVSGGQALMRRPRARLGLIAYWLVLHLWLVGTLL